jgi:hypothetical protein
VNTSSDGQSEFSHPVVAMNTSSDVQSEVSRLSLLEVTAATGNVTSASVATTYHSSDGQLTSDCPSLLVFIAVTAVTGNVTSVLVATIDHSSDERLSSRCPSLLQTIVAMGGLCPSLLWYHCSDAVLAMGRMPVTTVADEPLSQWLFVVVLEET